MFSGQFVFSASMVAGLLASVGLAQPADRQASISGAVAAAQALAPTLTAREAELKPRNGTWVVEVELVGGAQNVEREIKLNADTFTVVEDETDQIDSDDLAEINALLARLNEVTVTSGAAMTTASAAPAAVGGVLTEIELEIEQGVVVWDVKFIKMGAEVKIRVNASTGQVIGSAGGGSGGDDDDDDDDSNGNGGGGGGGVATPLITAAQATTSASNALAALNESGTLLETELKVRRGGAIYEVKFLVGQVIREVKVNAVTSQIIEIDTEQPSREDRRRRTTLAANPTSLLITPTQASQAVRDRFPGARIGQVKLRADRLFTGYETQVRVAGRNVKVLVSGSTGVVTVRR